MDRPNSLCLANVGDGTAIERINEAIRMAIGNIVAKLRELVTTEGVTVIG